MIICHCLAINDRRIRDLVDDGATVTDIAAECGAGRSCGTCVATIRAILASTEIPVAVPS